MTIITKDLSIMQYKIVMDKMINFNTKRQIDSNDEIWFLEHPAVYTLGQATDKKNIPVNNDNIPIIQSNRGGQITYHNIGQLIIYPLLQLKRYNLGIKSLVFLLEQVIIDLLATKNIIGHRREAMPGVYVNNKKIAALGLRVSKGCTYHGLSLNIAMDLKPYDNINPCGYNNLIITQTSDLNPDISMLYCKSYLKKNLISAITTFV
ncbi:MAG: octanoyltransferase [Gammaproteobacteria bacterium]|nr:MAG: octanoyltransferase [Gammaproteobacteria bacterium]